MRHILLAGFVVLAAIGCGGDTEPRTSDDTGAPVTDTTPGGTPTGGTPTGGTPTGCAAEMQVEIGTGDMAFEPLSEGDEVAIVLGPQGGWHITTAAVVTGSGAVVSAGPVIYWRSPDGDVPIAGADEVPTGVALDNYDDETCSGDVVGQLALVNDYLPSTPYQEWICSLRGETLRIEMTVTDLTTYEQATSTLEVVARPDPETNPC